MAERNSEFRRRTTMNTAIQINGRAIASGCPVYIIAGLSANHNQDFDQAVKIIDVAKQAGAELDHADALLRQAGNGRNNGEIKFLQTRLQHANKMRRRAALILDNPIMKMLGG